jgi:hydrogenase maturation protease
MRSADGQLLTNCRHASLAAPAGLALISVGSSLTGDGILASSACKAVSEVALKNVCRFDPGSYDGYLADCLAGHKAAIIVDSTSNGTAPYTVSIIDLSAVLEGTWPLNIQSCHGLSLTNELQLAKRSGKLPERIIFFGVEVGEASGEESAKAQLPQTTSQLVSRLSVLISTVLETVKRDL